MDDQIREMEEARRKAAFRKQVAAAGRMLWSIVSPAINITLEKMGEYEEIGGVTPFTFYLGNASFSVQVEHSRHKLALILMNGTYAELVKLTVHVIPDIKDHQINDYTFTIFVNSFRDLEDAPYSIEGVFLGSYGMYVRAHKSLEGDAQANQYLIQRWSNFENWLNRISAAYIAGASQISQVEEAVSFRVP
jgi:hypothetical protein